MVYVFKFVKAICAFQLARLTLNNDRKRQVPPTLFYSGIYHGINASMFSRPMAGNFQTTNSDDCTALYKDQHALKELKQALSDEDKRKQIVNGIVDNVCKDKLHPDLLGIIPWVLRLGRMIVIRDGGCFDNNLNSLNDCYGVVATDSHLNLSVSCQDSPAAV